MATITSSVVLKDLRVGGAKGLVLAEHHWDDGAVWPAVFEALAGENAITRLTAMIADRQAMRKADEISSNVAQVLINGSLAVIRLVMSTAVENFAAGRTAYLTATRIEAIMCGDYLSSLTNAQLQTAFSMTAGQVTTLRTNKLTPAANTASTIRAATGQ